jgi:lipoate-protein ligase A
MKKLRFIFDSARSAAMNMAIDELLFDSFQDEPVLRVYFWDGAYATIGYFQKNDCNAVRRLTGGLLVNHKNDLSYGFCVSAQEWPYLYSQQDTYQYIHAAMKKALLSINIESDFAEIKHAGEKSLLCVQTLFGSDLMKNGEKIAGSCMRRRGKKILAQGSLHLDLGQTGKEKFSGYFAENIAALLKAEVKKEPLTETELLQAAGTAQKKYLNEQWNKKF